MKRIVGLLLMSLMLIGLCGCTGSSLEAGNAKFQIIANSGSVFAYVIQDEATGVWYICTPNGVSPRYNADGTLYVTD